MARLSSILRGGEGTLSFFCPGCKDVHIIGVDGTYHANWDWNQDVEKPTFRPSILVRTGHYEPRHKQGDVCWCDVPRTGDGYRCLVCHSFVTEGRIEFLSDSTHELSGQTVPIPEWPYDDTDSSR